MSASEHLILGIDEVGRGPWAGPLVMGGCVLPSHSFAEDEFPEELNWILELTDSKKLSRARRSQLSSVIKENALAFSTGWVSAAELNEIGLSAGLRLACRRVIENIRPKKVVFHEIIIDGPTNFLKNTSLERYVTNLNKADLLIKEVSAASIIAKVEHDEYMMVVDEKYPRYGFRNHVGYGTAAHIAAIEKYGLTPEHRTFIKRLAGMARADEADLRGGVRPKKNTTRTGNVAEGKVAKSPKKNTMRVGSEAEGKVAEFLEGRGHKIIERNFKTKICEIDIVSSREGVIYFTEVKYRKTARQGSGFEAITKDKLRRMTFAAEVYLKAHPNIGLAPRLAAAQVSGVEFRVDDWVEI